MDVHKYLARIGLDSTGSVADLASLRLLQRQHLLNVPFENLDIHWDRPIVLQTDKFYDKIVNENRGGFCYELNSLFNELLRAAGFETRLLSARVSDGHGGFSPEFDHLAIMVIMGEMHYLADVGFGAFTAAPLQFIPSLEQQQDDAGIFIIKPRDSEYFEVLKKEGRTWRSEYMFRPFGHDISEFADRCDFQQYSSESHFLKGQVCSVMTEDGRKTLTDDKFIITKNGEKFEKAVGSRDEFNQVLIREFDILPISVSTV